MYDVYSKHADDFINHEEILETLAYADENKANEALINSILKKARLRKGLSHREASVLLACQMEEKNQEIYKLAEQIKKDFYGNRIVMFAPLYLSNYCVNRKKSGNLQTGRADQKGFLREPDRHVRTALSVQLLRKRLYLLPVSSEKQTYRKETADAGGDPQRSHCTAGYGA